MSVDRNANQHLHDRFDEVHARYTQLRQGVSDFQRDLAVLEVTVKSPDGMVTVVVGPRGNLKPVTLHERAYAEHPPERLSRLITEASQRAEAEVSRAIQTRLGQIMPEGSGVDAILQRHDRIMGYADER